MIWLTNCLLKDDMVDKLLVKRWYGWQMVLKNSTPLLHQVLHMLWVLQWGRLWFAPLHLSLAVQEVSGTTSIGHVCVAEPFFQQVKEGPAGIGSRSIKDAFIREAAKKSYFLIYRVPHIFLRFFISLSMEGRAIKCIKSSCLLNRKTIRGTP